ncbi:glycosyltransferase family 2 protein [Variovorax sp. J31P207]|uniref:glycosyltransferase family 2 protein n=1 Tax=Variovorax sp. J31P207 TaxID=3053510 RepID=UPI002576F7D9|nr:glycosyltransferase family 2 protein [Variovorax sp. J31P207]MDM0065643.1 glycosyltransferase family 2 protein [Variovorax sp. J31P207]
MNYSKSMLISTPDSRQTTIAEPGHRNLEALVGVSESVGVRQQSLSIVIPARNEAAGLAQLLPALAQALPGAEIIVSDDGSTDDTAAVAESLGARVFSRPYGAGNGAAIKAGARVATGDLIVFMDGDGQHRAQDVLRLLSEFGKGYDMVVGERNSKGQANLHRGWANSFYNRLASWMVGRKVGDLTSGFRVVRASRFREFLYLLPNGFSYPTTSTMAFFRAGYTVAYVPIEVQSRMAGTQSHIRLWRDGLRFLLIIFKIGTLYSPLKLFAPVSMAFFAAGLANYAKTYFTEGRFTNMSVLMFSASVIVFLIGLISEQITALMYKDTDNGQPQPPRQRPTE